MKTWVSSLTVVYRDFMWYRYHGEKYLYCWLNNIDKSTSLNWTTGPRVPSMNYCGLGVGIYEDLCSESLFAFGFEECGGTMSIVSPLFNEPLHWFDGLSLSIWISFFFIQVKLYFLTWIFIIVYSNGQPRVIRREHKYFSVLKLFLLSGPARF